MNVDDQLKQAHDLCDRVVFAGDDSVIAEADRALDAVEAELALARGRVLHARFLDERVANADELACFQRAAELFERVGDTAGWGRACFQIGVYHQLVAGDDASAAPFFRRAAELAEGIPLSYALRHLGIDAHKAGRLDEARDLLERSTRIRREHGFAAGVAANLVGLAYLARAQERHEDAAALLDEADELARSSGAHRISSHVAQARLS